MAARTRVKADRRDNRVEVMKCGYGKMMENQAEPSQAEIGAEHGPNKSRFERPSRTRVGPTQSEGS